MHRRVPSGLQASSVTSSGSRVSWAASPPSMGSSQTWTAPAAGWLLTGTGGPVAGTAGRQHRAAIAQEGERPCHPGSSAAACPGARRASAGVPAPSHPPARATARSGRRPCPARIPGAQNTMRVPSGDSRTSVGERSAYRSSGLGGRGIGILGWAANEGVPHQSSRARRTGRLGVRESPTMSSYTSGGEYLVPTPNPCRPGGADAPDRVGGRPPDHATTS